jgi:hypothetical protein
MTDSTLCSDCQRAGHKWCNCSRPAPQQEQAAPVDECFCDKHGLGVKGASCGDCPRDYSPPKETPRED